MFDYPDLFKLAADTLRDLGFFHEALRFYKPIKQISEYADASYLLDMALCYRAAGLNAEALNCYQTIIDRDQDIMEAQLQMTILCQQLRIPGKANERTWKPSSAAGVGSMESRELSIPKATIGDPTSNSSLFTAVAPQISRRIANGPLFKNAVKKKINEENTLLRYFRMQKFLDNARMGDVNARTQWMMAAKSLIEDFQSERIFFPSDKSIKFCGFSKEARKKSSRPRVDRAINEAEKNGELSSPFLLHSRFQSDE